MFANLRQEPYASWLHAEIEGGGAGGVGREEGEGLGDGNRLGPSKQGGWWEGTGRAASARLLEQLDGLLAGLDVDGGVVGGEIVEGGRGEEKLEAWRDEYRKDAIVGVSLCFRCADLSLSAPQSPHMPAAAGWHDDAGAAAQSEGGVTQQGGDGPLEGCGGGGGGSGFLPTLLAKLSSFVANSPAINVCLLTLVARLLAYPEARLHLLLTTPADSRLPSNTLTFAGVLAHINEEVCPAFLSDDVGCASTCLQQACLECSRGSHGSLQARLPLPSHPLL